MREHLGRIFENVGELPGLLHWRRRRFDRRFEAGRAIGCCRGVFETSAQAASTAPTTRPLGYDHIDAAKMYRDRVVSIYPADYPMLVWLQNAFATGAARIFDLGGHIGVSYYAYQKVIPFPTNLSWQVSDVPAVMISGREEAKQRDPTGRLTFTEEFSSAADSDLLFTSGCIQYLDSSLAQRIESLPRKPQWVLVNLLPLHSQHDYWTLQSIGTAFCPYHIQQSAQFFSAMEQVGYRLLDKWENLEKNCWIAFEPTRSLDRYYGAAFRLQ